MTKKSNKKIYIYAGIAVAIMFGFCFAIVPLYSVLCKLTGMNTVITPELSTAANDKAVADNTVDMSREITVQLMAVNNMGLPWDFYPKVKSIKVHPGENTKVYFYAKNTTDKDMTVQAIPNMTPTDAISHFHKIECFCFRQQTLKAHESKDMLLLFKIDKEVPKDMRVITLAYTLFDQTPKAKQDVKKG